MATAKKAATNKPDRETVDGYQLMYTPKVKRAKLAMRKAHGSSMTPKHVLVEYARIGGRILDSKGVDVDNSKFWNFDKGTPA